VQKLIVIDALVKLATRVNLTNIYEQLFANMYSFANTTQTQTISIEKLLITLLYEEFTQKMLMKLTEKKYKGRNRGREFRCSDFFSISSTMRNEIPFFQL
jgi:hypothetical protein